MSRPDFQTWDRANLAAHNRWGYARLLERPMREILVQLERLNRDTMALNRAVAHAWLAEGGWVVLARSAEGPPRLHLFGFVAPRHLRPLAGLRIAANGRPLPVQEVGVPDKMDDPIQPLAMPHLGFRAEIDGLDAERIEEPVELSVVDGAGRPALDWWKSAWLMPGWGPLPDQAHMERVGAREGPANFMLHGGTLIRKLDEIARRHAGAPLFELDGILDWGCGCGRMLRHVPPPARRRFTGIDLDTVNVAWCRANLPGIRFEPVSSRPPTRLAAGSFDLIYGNSVVTHLREPDLFAWLAELRRLTRPGGLVCLTAHARFHWATLGWFESASLLDLLETGIRVAADPNPDLADVAGNFYVDTAHTYEHIYTHWSRYFEVVDILENFSRDQALVILRRAD